LKTACWMVAGLVLGASQLGLADSKRTLQVVPWVADPDGTGTVTAEWVKLKGKSKSHEGPWALYFREDGPTTNGIGGGAALVGVSGLRLKELGYDYRGDGHCGSGAPRFNVVTDEGHLYFVECDYGEHSATRDPGWIRVRFTDASVYPQYLENPPWPGFGHVVIRSLNLVFDEGTDAGPGFVYLTRIDVNGKLISGPHKVISRGE